MTTPRSPAGRSTTERAAGRAVMLALALAATGLQARAQTFPPPPPSALGTAPRTPVVAPPRSPHAEKPRPVRRHAEHRETVHSDAPATPRAKAAPKPSHPAPFHGAPSHPPPPAPAVVPTPNPAPGAVSAPASPPPGLDPNKGSVTGQELPRWASLRSDDVNLRIGPGTNFQIDWVYHRRDLPVRIEREYEVWRQVEDMDGIKGWVHQATLAGRRTFVIKDAQQTLRASADDAAAPVAKLKPGVVGRIRSCAANVDWCEVQTGDYRGFLKREEFSGTFPGEAVNP